MISKTQQIIQLASEGYRQSDIAKKVGVSRQFVSQIYWKHNISRERESRTTLSSENCVYPALRDWWNENNMSYKKFFDLMQMNYHGNNIKSMEYFFIGNRDIRKSFIDKLITVTGFPYEQLFYRDGD